MGDTVTTEQGVAMNGVTLDPVEKPLGDQLLGAWERQDKLIRAAVDTLARAVDDASLNTLEEAVERAVEILHCRTIEARVAREEYMKASAELDAEKAVTKQMQLRQTQAAAVLESWAKGGIADAAALFAIGKALSGSEGA